MTVGFLASFSGPSPSNRPLFLFVLLHNHFALAPFPRTLHRSLLALPLFYLLISSVGAAPILAFITSDTDGQYNDVSIIYHLYIRHSSLLVLYLPHTASGRMISRSFSKSLVSLALDIVHSFTSRTGSDRTGQDFIPPPPMAFVIVLLAIC